MENMLSKVMQEFEHRLARQNEQVGALSLLVFSFFYLLYKALLPTSSWLTEVIALFSSWKKLKASHCLFLIKVVLHTFGDMTVKYFPQRDSCSNDR